MENIDPNKRNRVSFLERNFLKGVGILSLAGIVGVGTYLVNKSDYESRNNDNNNDSSYFNSGNVVNIYGNHNTIILNNRNRKQRNPIRMGFYDVDDENGKIRPFSYDGKILIDIDKENKCHCDSKFKYTPNEVAELLLKDLEIAKQKKRLDLQAKTCSSLDALISNFGNNLDANKYSKILYSTDCGYSTGYK